MISWRQGTTRAAHAFCDSSTLVKNGSLFDLSSITLSQAVNWASRTDLGVLTTLTPCLVFISIRSVELRSIIFQVKSADSAIAAYLMTAWRSFGSESYFFLLMSSSRHSIGWW